jgi:hypothetical protein
LTFSSLIPPSEPDPFPFLQGDAVTSVALARFLRPFSRFDGSVSSSTSGAQVLYRFIFHHFERFLNDYESRFEKEYGLLRPHSALEYRPPVPEALKVEKFFLEVAH